MTHRDVSLLMAYSRLYIVFQMFGIGHWKLPACGFSAACAIGYRKQVHYSGWQCGMKQQKPKCGLHALHFQQLHTPDSTDSFPQFTFPQQIRCSKGSGTPPPLKFSRRKGARRGTDASKRLLPERLPPLLRLILSEPPQAPAAAEACTVKGVGGDLIL